MTLPLLDESAAMSATTPVVIGLDLSLTGTGFAGPDGTKVFRSTGHKGDTLDQRADRLTALLFDVLDAIDDWNVDLVTIEQPSFGQSRGSSGAVTDRAGLWWLIVHALHSRGIAVAEVPPATLKKYVTGKGNAGKGLIAAHLVKRFDVLIEDDNAADAFALRALGLDLLGHPLVQLPAVNRTALEKLPRPEMRGAA